MAAPKPEPPECGHQWLPHHRNDNPDEPYVRTCSFCGRPNWDDIDKVVSARIAPNSPGAEPTAAEMQPVVDASWLRQRIGRGIIARNPVDRDMWQGALAAVHDEPTVVLDQGCGQRVTLPQSLEFEDAPPPPLDDVDDRLLWVLHRAVDEWGAAGVAEVANRMAGRWTP